MAIEWCWKGRCVNYGTIFNPSGSQVSSGRLNCSDLQTLQNLGFTFQEGVPEDFGLQRDSKDDTCSICNDFKFPPDFSCENVPSELIFDIKNNNNPNLIAPQTVRLEVILNPDIDRVAIMKILWDFGDGLTAENQGLSGGIQRIQNHNYQAGTFNGLVTIQILDTLGNILNEESRPFLVTVPGELPIIPLSLIVDRIPPEGPAPLEVKLEIIGNQAIENIQVDFGDGSPIEIIGVQRSVTHIYLDPGLFNAVIQATSKLSEETIAKTVQINVIAPFDFVVNVTPNTEGDPLEAFFDIIGNHDILPSPIIWEFGDGTVIKIDSPLDGRMIAQLYKNEGIFNGKVTATSELSGETKTIPFTVQVPAIPTPEPIPEDEEEEPEPPFTEPPEPQPTPITRNQAIGIGIGIVTVVGIAITLRSRK